MKGSCMEIGRLFGPHRHPILMVSISDTQRSDKCVLGAKDARIRPTRRDSHGGRSGDCLSRACIACQHCAVDSSTYKPPTCEEARGVEAPFKSFRVPSTHKGEEPGGGAVSREEVRLRSICASYPRPLIAISQRFRSCTGTSVLSVCPGSYSVVQRWCSIYSSPAKRQP